MKRFAVILGVILLVLGVVGLVHPDFTYHQQEEVAKIVHCGEPIPGENSYPLGGYFLVRLSPG